MSKLQELIDRLCPNGVEFKSLSAVMIPLRKGTLKISDLIENGKYPVINSGRELYGYYDRFNNEAPAITIAARGEYAGWVSFFEERFWAGGLCYPYKSKDETKVATKFIYYWLKNQERDIMDNLVARGSIPALNKADIDKYSIPIPPLEVQDEIVKILDRFSDYAAELQAELQARRLQYEYYRNLLLTFNSSAYGCGTDDAQKISVIARGGHSYEIQWKTMGEICKKTKNIKWKDNPTKECLYIDLSSVDCETHGFSNQLITINAETAPSRAQQIVETNDVLFGTTRPTLMRFAIVPQKLSGNICSTGYVVLRANAEIVLPKFLYFILNTRRFLSFVENNQEGAGYPSISLSKLQSFYLPIPPLELQEKIVAILDRFETLVNDLSKGLPAEIEAVKARYEYYRNKLLTFNPLSA